MPQSLIGGSFAPPLSDAKLSAYKEMVDALPASPVKDALEKLLHCCGVWWELPEPKHAGEPHPLVGTIVWLHRDHKAKLDEHIPWKHELETMKDLFETISNETQKPLRDAAHHLLWHVCELDLDREPMTSDKLPK